VTGLGFMIITNPKDESDDDDNNNSPGMKDVSFVMLFSDDTFQDEWGVCCGKNHLYQECLPEHIDTVYFISDGAGCYKSKLHKTVIPFWKIWTGITEKRNRVTPAGDGKTALDGMFGQLMFLLGGAVDSGASYYDAGTILDTIEDDTRRLKATSFRKYTPDRRNQVKCDLPAGSQIDSVLTTEPDPLEKNLFLFKHSGYGDGLEVDLTSQTSFFWCPENSEMYGEKDKAQFKEAGTKKDELLKLVGKAFNDNVSFSWWYRPYVRMSL
jgi:hypothetical protein